MHFFNDFCKDIDYTKQRQIIVFTLTIHILAKGAFDYDLFIGPKGKRETGEIPVRSRHCEVESAM